MHHPPISAFRLRLGIPLLGILLLGYLTAALVACGGGDPTAEPSSTEEPDSITTIPTQAPLPSTDLTSLPVSALPSVADLIDQVKPSVVSISIVEVSLDLFLRPTAGQGNGSGVIVREDGYIITNYHVIKDAEDIRVHLSDGRAFWAEVVGQDPLTDLAIVRIDAEGLPALPLGDSRELRVGEWVVSMGNALGLQGGATATIGIVSAKDRSVRTEIGDLYGLVQTDAAINHGSSGGAMVNTKGELVGINTVIIQDAQGLGFAVGASTVRPILESLIEHGRVIRPLIGLVGQDVTPLIANELDLKVSQGVLITAATPDGPSALAGLEVGDVITKLDTILTRDMGEFLQALWSYSVGDAVQVEYVRDGDTSTVQVTLIERK